MIFHFQRIKVFYNFSTTKRLVLIRHGESIWNKEKRWAGWTDIPLSIKGISEGQQCGRVLKEHHFQFDEAYTSVLKRSITSLNSILNQLDLHYIPVHKSYLLNGKFYGALEGLNEIEIIEKFGEKQAKQWSKDLTIPSLKVQMTDHRHPMNDKKYKNLQRQQLPCSESINHVIERASKIIKSQMLEKIQKNQKLLVVAHRSSIRGIISVLTNRPIEEIRKFNIPNATPLIIELNTSDLTFHSISMLSKDQEINQKIALFNASLQDTSKL